LQPIKDPESRNKGPLYEVHLQIVQLLIIDFFFSV